MKFTMMNNIDLKSIRENETPVGTKKMNINGEVKYMDVFRIPLNMLYYNDQNDRIATYISRYNSKGQNINNLPIEERNKIIEEYIIQADKNRFETTKNNIEEFSQLEPGVVLTDGRIIDGNRRFTCLRSLFGNGNQKYNRFEAVILDSSEDEKQLKIMELVLQHGREERVDYNPIEKLVGIYRDIIKNKKLTIEEYKNSTGKTLNDVKKSVDLAYLMADFLKYIGAEEEFYIAKDFEIDGPLNEFLRIKKKVDETEWRKIRIVLYDNIIMKTKINGSGDITRNIRYFGDQVIPNENLFKEYYEKHEPLSRKLHEKLMQCNGEITTDYIRDNIRNDAELSDKINEIFNDTLDTAKRNEAKNLPIEILTGINKDISRLDKTAVGRLQGNLKNQFSKQLELLENQINQIKEIIENGIQ